MKVWIVIRGMYSDQNVDAVFSTAEKAMAAYPGETWEYGTKWGERWTNTKDLSEFIGIWSFVLDSNPDQDWHD